VVRIAHRFFYGLPWVYSPALAAVSLIICIISAYLLNVNAFLAFFQSFFGAFLCPAPRLILRTGSGSAPPAGDRRGRTTAGLVHRIFFKEKRPF